MAETANPEEPKPDAQEPKKKGSKIVIIGIALVICLALGGGGYVFLSRRALASSKKAGKAQTPPKQTDSPPVAIIHLDSFVVNLADPGGNSFLRVTITVGLDKPLPKEMETSADSSPFIPEIRDAVLGVLTTWQSENLLAIGGKTKLKTQLLSALQQRVPELGVSKIYFTDFLIQQ